jgi:myo-inositol-1(or 4)-monophosphatase
MSRGAFRDNATRIVREGAAIARDYFGRTSVLREKAFHDIVTEADLAVEQHIVAALRGLYPDHGFLAEEGGADRTDAEYVWVLDPIDGTKYYARSVPLYAVSLALLHRGRPVMGIVHTPQMDQFIDGIVGEGARLNGEPIRCSQASRLEDATLCAEIPSRDSDAALRERGLAQFAELVRAARRVRVLGLGSLGLCYSAMAGFDAYVNLGGATKDVDVAAGGAIILAAGGEFRRQGPIMLGGPAELLSQIEQVIGGPGPARTA